MTGEIYLIFNVVNGKRYVGQTMRSVLYRFKQHKYEARIGDNSAIHKAIRKWGVDKFVVTRVISCDPSLLDDLERYYIKFYHAFAPAGHGYNLTRGGGNGFDDTGCKVTSMEGRARLSEVHKGNSYARGHRISDEGRALISEAMKRRKPVILSKEARAKISATLKGHSVSAESKAKMSVSHKGVKIGYRKRKPMSEEHKAKIAASLKARLGGRQAVCI